MGIIMYLAIFMVIVGGVFLCIFLYAVKNGQFEDLETPSHKLLIDDSIEEKSSPKDKQINADTKSQSSK